MEQSNFLNDSTNESRLLLELYGKIIDGELTTFESLKKAVSRYKVTNDLRRCLFRAFELQRKLYWGFFRDLTPKAYPLLWQEIVIVDSQFRFGGDLKRLMSIPDIYLGLLDIHGYTRYCNDKKRNMSMIDLLDRMIYEDVDAICAENGVISKRAQGDEILVLGASAANVLKSVLQIMNYFNTQGRSFRNTVLSRKLPGTVLPKFQISAGIAGGQKFTPLVITRDGDISGDIVNTAARLQAKANKISPDKNRIMITSHVYQKLRAAEAEKPDEEFASIDYFNMGTIEFKGVSQNVYDIVFLPEEKDRLNLREQMEVLYTSLEKRRWKTKIFKDALDTTTKLLSNQLSKGCKDTAAGRRLENSYRETLELLKKTYTLFNSMYYEAAISSFSRIIDSLSGLGNLDRIVIEYLELVKRNYLVLNDRYSGVLDEEVVVRLNEVCSPQEKENYLLLKKHRAMYDKLRSSTRLKLKSRKTTWHRITDEIGEELNINLQSFK
ncbi:MAG: adenylate/guanylate cyclase domain-containing protein [Spirochaetales bacterium]|uniref:Adenylate/guanylate cyclase domain-containing protein n=1 Tax=Candidatus Thalassospirochaeta sargassi TaxID=3119039 RepID=A0AAJ1ILU3_9SPIO|nr:adenylate/guanylate cyclase domain-containing protein [Spirochaetales bacterium]